MSCLNWEWHERNIDTLGSLDLQEVICSWDASTYSCSVCDPWLISSLREGRRSLFLFIRLSYSSSLYSCLYSSKLFHLSCHYLMLHCLRRLKILTCFPSVKRAFNGITNLFWKRGDQLANVQSKSNAIVSHSFFSLLRGVLRFGRVIQHWIICPPHLSVYTVCTLSLVPQASSSLLYKGINTRERKICPNVNSLWVLPFNA